jgi:hypothetical protein
MAPMAVLARPVDAQLLCLYITGHNNKTRRNQTGRNMAGGTQTRRNEIPTGSRFRA